MANQVDSMSDAELRAKLAEHGFPIMPITVSTRNLLVKKLKLVLDNKSKPRNSVDSKVVRRRTLAQYSSGEESDLDTTGNAREKQGRRATTGGAMLPPVTNKPKRQPPVKKGSPVKGDSDKGSKSEEEKSPIRRPEEVETVTTSRLISFAMANQVDSMSDAELRAKLAEHGFPIMPITVSTRNLLVKKLKLVLDNKSKPRNSVDSKVVRKRTLAQYSSGEESDLDTTGNAREKQGRRATTGVAMLPPVTNKPKSQLPVKKGSPVKGDSDKGSKSTEEKSPIRRPEEVETVTTSRLTSFAMANQVDSMSDAELRAKLAEHGFPIMPITVSTRNLLVKKLKLVLDNKSKPRNSVDSKVVRRRTLAQYSSGEESDLDTTRNAREKRGRWATTGGAMLPPVTKKPKHQPPVKKGLPVKGDSDKGSESKEEKSPIRRPEEVETVTTRRLTTNEHDDYETGSNSDVDSGKSGKKTSSPFRSNSRSSYYISSTLPTNDAATCPPRSSIFSRPSIAPGFSSSLSSSDHLNSIRSRLRLTSTLSDRPSAGTSTTGFTSSNKPLTSTVGEVESPYLSNFARRLTSLKSDPPKPTSFVDRDANNGCTILPRRSYITGVSRSDVVGYKTANDRNFSKNT